MAYAAAEFANKVIHNIAVPTSSFTTQAYVPLEADPEGAKLVTDTCGTPVDYFSANVKIGVRPPIPIPIPIPLLSPFLPFPFPSPPPPLFFSTLSRTANKRTLTIDPFSLLVQWA